MSVRQPKESRNGIGTRRQLLNGIIRIRSPQSIVLFVVTFTTTNIISHITTTTTTNKHISNGTAKQQQACEQTRTLDGCQGLGEVQMTEFHLLVRVGGGVCLTGIDHSFPSKL